MQLKDYTSVKEFIEAYKERLESRKPNRLYDQTETELIRNVVLHDTYSALIKELGLLLEEKKIL